MTQAMAMESAEEMASTPTNERKKEEQDSRTLVQHWRRDRGAALAPPPLPPPPVPDAPFPPPCAAEEAFRPWFGPVVQSMTLWGIGAPAPTPATAAEDAGAGATMSSTVSRVSLSLASPLSLSSSSRASFSESLSPEPCPPSLGEMALSPSMPPPPWAAEEPEAKCGMGGDAEADITTNEACSFMPASFRCAALDRDDRLRDPLAELPARGSWAV